MKAERSEEEEEAYLVEKANVSSMKPIWMEKTAESKKRQISPQLESTFQ